jgi:integrase
VFLYGKVLGTPLGDLGGFAYARTTRRLPTVLTRAEVQSLLGQMRGGGRLMAALLYGTGMRLMECVRLRVLDLDFGYGQINVRHGKGGKDRVVPLPEALAPLLRGHLDEVRRRFEADRAEGHGEVYLPEALARSRMVRRIAVRAAARQRQALKRRSSFEGRRVRRGLSACGSAGSTGSP